MPRRVMEHKQKEEEDVEEEKKEYVLKLEFKNKGNFIDS